MNRIRSSLTEHTASIRMHSLVTSCIDYSKSLCFPSQAPPLASTASKYRPARVNTRTSSFHHTSPVLCRLYWLPFKFKLEYESSPTSPTSPLHNSLLSLITASYFILLFYAVFSCCLLCFSICCFLAPGVLDCLGRRFKLIVLLSSLLTDRTYKESLCSDVYTFLWDCMAAG